MFCDIIMPELDGYGVLHIRSKNNETAKIPFVFLTAKTEKTDIRKGMELGADDYLTKPFSDTELLNAIGTRLRKYALRVHDYSSTPEGLDTFIRDAQKTVTGEVTLNLYKGNLQVASRSSPNSRIASSRP